MAETKPTSVTAPPPAVALEFLSPADEIEQRPFPRAARVTLFALVLALLAGGGWAAIAEIDRVVTATGKLVTTTATMVVQPLETAVIRSIAVRPGDLVRKGDVLASFDPTFTEADVGQLEGRLRSLEAQIRRLEAELASADSLADATATSHPGVQLQTRLFTERREYHMARLRQFDESEIRLEAKLATNRREQQVLRERLKTLKQIEDMRQELLARQSGSRLNLLEARDQMLEVERLLAASSNSELELKQEAMMIAAERATFVTDWRQKAAEELVKARGERDAAAEQLAKAARRNELVVMTAPADGVVLEVAKRSVGSVAQPAEPLITLVPAEAPLEAEVQIEARDIGLLRLNDAARVKLEAFPFQRHGTLPAKLRTISEDAFSRREEAERTGTAYYVARLEVENYDLRGVPPDTRLLPGLTLTAEIIIGKRTVLSYLIYPMIKAFDESLREP